jgi:DNA replication protein DnaC
MNKAEAAALSIIKSRKTDAELRAAELLDALREDPVFSQIEAERDILRFGIAKLKSKNTDFGHLKEKYEEAEKNFLSYLSSKNLKPEELLPQYACKKCGDTGFVRGRLCECVRQLAYKTLKNNCRALITSIDDFTKIDYTFVPEASRAAYKGAADILDRFLHRNGQSRISVIGLSGKQGTGKTFLLSVLANAMMKSCATVLFYNSVQLNEIFLRYHLAPVEEKEDIFEPLTEADFLVIDDLGAENLIKNVTETYLYELLVFRADKLTGFTSNMNAIQLLERYGHRIASRLCSKENSFIIHLDGKDLRFKNE